mgnify:CR=1 FL=1
MLLVRVCDSEIIEHTKIRYSFECMNEKEK